LAPVALSSRMLCTKKKELIDQLAEEKFDQLADSDIAKRFSRF
jgi:hypothetical protein